MEKGAHVHDQEAESHHTCTSAVQQLFATGMHHLEYTRNRIASAVLLFYWLFVLFANVIKLRTLLMMHQLEVDPTQFILFAVSATLGAIMFVLENVHRPKSQYVMLEEDEVSEKEAICMIQ